MLRVRTSFTGPPGTPWLSTMYFDGASQAIANAAVSAIGAFWSAVDASMNLAVSWATEPDVPELNPSDGSLAQTFSTTPQTGSGGSTGDLLPLVAQGLVRWRTAGVVAGRTVRGRSFIPGVSEAFAVGGRPQSTALANWNAAAAALIADASTELRIWARPFEGNPLADPPQPARLGTSHAVTSGVAWNEFASMRSRRD